MEDVAWLTLLALCGETDSMGIILEGENHIELKYLMVTLTASRPSEKSTYATWL